MRKLAEKISSGKGYVAPAEYRKLAAATVRNMVAEKQRSREIVFQSRAIGYARA
jgi:hypothetical protein